MDIHDEDDGPDPMKIGGYEIKIVDIVTLHDSLVSQFKLLEPRSFVATVAGLMTLPQLQCNVCRLEAMAYLATCYSEGDRIADLDVINKAFVTLGDGPCGLAEDPAEDTFSSLVTFSGENFRIIEGSWESAAFYLQRTLNVIESMPAQGAWKQLADSALALLRLSDAICARASLGRWEFGAEDAHDSVVDANVQQLDEIRERCVFSSEDISALQISEEALEPFIFDLSLTHHLASASLQHSPLLDYPLIRIDGQYLLALPAAVSVAIRRLVFGSAIQAGLRKAIIEPLANEYYRLFNQTTPFNLANRAPLTFKLEGDFACAEYAVEFEPGRHAHVFVILDALIGFELEGFSGCAGTQEDIEELIASSTSTYRECAVEHGGFQEGVSFVIYCGIGRPAMLGCEAIEDERWSTVILGAPDVETISLLGDISPSTAMRLNRAEIALQNQGAHLMYLGGFIDLLASSRLNGGHLVDHKAVPSEFATGTGCIYLGTSLALSVRKEVLQKTDRHFAKLPDGKKLLVRRIGDGIFAEDKAYPLYATEELSAEHGFRLLYRGRMCDWWCKVSPTKNYPRFKMMRTWLPKIASAFDRRFPSLSCLPLSIHVSFNSVRKAGYGRVAPATKAEIAGDITYSIDVDAREIRVDLGEVFERGFAVEENVSEAALVSAIIEAALELTQGECQLDTKQSLQLEVVRNSDGRDYHLLYAQKFRDWVRDDIPKSPVEIDLLEEAIHRTGLGWRFRDRAEGPHIAGKQECTDFLNSVVRGLEEDLIAELRAYQRVPLIMLALRTHEAAMVVQRRWRTTARAALGLRDDQDEAMQTILEQDFRNNGSLMASRILVEIAICESPEQGGLEPGESDLARLMSILMLIIHYGNWSDAIHFEAMERSLTIRPLGDIHVDVTFQEEVVEPFGRVSGETILQDSIDGYSKFFSQPNVSSADGNFDDRFSAAWTAEKGISIDDVRKFTDAIEDIGIDRKSAIFVMTLSELRESLSDDVPSLEDVINIFLSRPRSTWQELPPDTTDKDRWPWRLRRQLSLLRRPLVQLSASEVDPRILITPGLLRDAMFYTLSGYYEGSFQHAQLKTSKMRSWVGNIARRRGQEFAEKVSKQVTKLGWQCNTEVPVRRILTGRENAGLGDIDVLAWHEEQSKVLLVECKHLYFAKSVGELAEQIKDYRGRLREGKPDDMLKHINRTNAILADLPALSAFLKLPNELSVSSWVIFRFPVPVQQAWSEGSGNVQVGTYEDLPEILANALLD